MKFNIKQSVLKFVAVLVLSGVVNSVYAYSECESWCWDACGNYPLRKCPEQCGGRSCNDQMRFGY